jgi:ParB family chromosome partitioning protein
MLMAGDIEMGHARALLPLSKSEQGRIAALIVDKGCSVREAERMVARELNPPQKKGEERKPDRDLLRLEEDLSDRLGATVKIAANRKGAGSLSIRFGSLDQLDGLLSRLG